METAISNGTGSQQPTGILVESDIPTIDLSGTITYDSILKLIGSLPTAYLANAKFVINKKTFYQQVLGLKDKNDRPLVRDIVLDGITRFQILGYEAIISDYYPDFESAKRTDKVISFGDLSYYKLNFNKPAQVKRSDDAFFEEGLIGFRVLAIADGRYTLPEAMINATKGTSSDVKKITDLIKVVDLSGENVPVASNDDKPVGGQIANAVIAKNKEATINDFNIADDSIVVTKKPVDGKPYQYGTYTAILTGAGNYEGTLDINGTFGRLNP